MSSTAGNEVDLNAIMCYFPWFPYYQRYQIGFDIVVPPNAQADPSEAQRVIHVRLYFPDGFICNPSNFGGMPEPASFGADEPQFLPPHPHFPPPMYPPHMQTNPYFQPHVPMGFPGPMIWQEQQDARVVVYVVNAQPGEFMVIDDTPYDVIPRCQVCNEFHTEPEDIHNIPPQGVPDSSEHVATDCKSNVEKEEEPNLTQQMAGQLHDGANGVVQEIQGENDIATSASNQDTAATITEAMSRLDVGGRNNDGHVAQDDKKPDADPKVDNDN